MRRRPWLIASGVAATGMIAWPMTSNAEAQPRYKVSRRQLEQVLRQRFPLSYAVAGLLQLRIQTPRLRLLPEQNRLAGELAIDASGEALRRSYSGDVDLDFALRYEPRDRTIRAHQIRVLAVRLPGLPPDAALWIDAYARAFARRTLLEVVLHTLSPEDLALPATMGLEPGSITVTADGLVIGFVERQPR